MQGNKPPDGDGPSRDATGKLLPGHTANPSGRSKIAKELRMYMAEFTRSHIDAITKIASNEAVEARDRLKAYMWLAEQVIGKPSQAITDEDGNPLRIGVVILPSAESDGD